MSTKSLKETLALLEDLNKQARAAIDSSKELLEGLEVAKNKVKSAHDPQISVHGDLRPSENSSKSL